MNGYRLRELKIEVNRNCPLHCLHCSSNGMSGAPESLDPRKISGLIEEFANLGGEKLCISGGEPLCYEELPFVIKHCRRMNLDVSLYTTGVIRNGGSLESISDKTADLLAESGIRVIFSLHGASAKTHDLLTQVRGSFEATMVAVDKVTSVGVPVEVHVVPTAINYNELVAITKLVSSLNIRKVSWLRFVPQGRGWFNKNILQLNKEQLRGLLTRKMELQEICPAVTIRTGAPFNILCPQVPASCEAGISELTISPDGYISPCDAFKRFRLHDDSGNVLHHSLTEVWLKSYTLHAVRTLHEARLDSSCALCSLYSRCNSGCLAQKAIAAGALTDGRDPWCPLGDVEVGRDEIKAITVC